MKKSRYDFYQTCKNSRIKNIIAFVLLFIALLFLLIVQTPVFADSSEVLSKEIDEQIENQLNNIDTSSFQSIIDKLNDEKSLFNNGSFLDNIKKLLAGENQIDFTNIFNVFISLFSKSLVSILPLVCSIIGIGILSSIITQTSVSKDESIKNIVHFVCFGLIITIVFTAVIQVISISNSTMNSLKEQMQISFPILLTLMTVIGANASVSVYQPLVAVLTGSLMSVFNNFVMPLFVFCLVFSVAGNLSNNIKLNKFKNMFENIFKWTIGITFTIFSSILAVQGITAGSFDGLSFRTTKYAMKSYIPFVGSYLSDGLNLILTSSVLIKNAIGTTGVILILATIISPIIKILILKLALSFSASILEPIADKKICDFLFSISKCLSMLIAIICVSSFAYFLTIGLVMCSGNFSF